MTYSGFARSLRFISRSIACRIRSRRTSPSCNSASIRAVVPSANGNCMRSVHCFLRPMRGALACASKSVKAAPISCICIDIYRIHDIMAIRYTIEGAEMSKEIKITSSTGNSAKGHAIYWAHVNGAMLRKSNGVGRTFKSQDAARKAAVKASCEAAS